MLREHRLYQSDWLLRFYGFDLREIEDAMEDGMLDLSLDPKLASARAAITASLCFVVWYSFLVVHVVNNVRGLFGR